MSLGNVNDFGGGASSSSGAPKFKNFVTEAEVEERKKKRQEEWEKVRQPDQPLEVPEEPIDARSLFEKLQEQKHKKDAEYEESHKLKNLIRGLDDDEVSFLELVDKTKIEMESRIILEEQFELNEYRKAVASFSEETAAAKMLDLKKGLNTDQQRKSKQQALLAKAVKRKSSADDSSCSEKATNSKESKEPPTKQSTSPGESDDSKRLCTKKIGMQCIGVLPGMGVYTDSSDSENSSGSESPETDLPFDLVGRRRMMQAHSHAN